MGEKEIRTLLTEAREKAWSDQALVQRASDMARAMHAPTLGRLQADERALLSAMSRIVGDAGSLRFVEEVCERVFCAKGDAVENLRQLMVSFGGVPTFFSSMSRLRLKAATMASRSMQGAALAEVKRVFRSTFGDLVLPTHMGKVSRRIDAMAKEGMQLMLQPLTPLAWGEKSAQRYQRNLEAILTKQPGVGIVVESWRLCPGLSPSSPELSAQTLAQRLYQLCTLAQQGGHPVVVATRCSDTLPIVVEAFKKVLDRVEMDQADVALELPAYLKTSLSLLRELADWAKPRAQREARPLKVLLVKGSHLEAEQECAALYGTGAQLCSTKAEADACFIRLVNAAVDMPARLLTPVVGTHELTHLCYAALRWARSKREGMLPIALIYGLGNHLGRQFARLGSPIMLQSGIAAEESESHAFERYLLDVVHELARSGGFLSAGYAPDVVDWSAKTKPLMVANSTRGEDVWVSPTAASGSTHGNLGYLLERANVNALYEAARAEKERVQDTLPLIIGGAEHHSPLVFVRRSLTVPGLAEYRFTSADYAAVERALRVAQEHVAAERMPEEARATALLRVARELGKRRAEFAALLVRDVGFTLQDAVVELRDAMDACRYYAHESLRGGMEDGTAPLPLGVVVLATGVAHPLAEALSGIAAAWMGGNSIIYMPPAYATLVSSRLTTLLCAFGIDVTCLPCVDDAIATRLISDARVKGIICTGSQRQANALAARAPHCSVLVTPSLGSCVYLAERCDWQRGLRDVVQAVYRRSGQSPDCPHTLLVHARVYDDPAFLPAVEDLVSSLEAKPTWLEGADLGPLAAPLSEAELKLLAEKRPGEAWLVAPRVSDSSPQLWMPGVSICESPAEEMPRHTLRLPLLGIVRVESTEDATARQSQLARGGRAVIYSQDAEEIDIWSHEIGCRWLAVNCCPATRAGMVPVPTCRTSLQGARAVMVGGRNYAAALCEWQEQVRPSLRSARRHLVFDPKSIFPTSSSPEEAMRLSAAADSISYWWEQEFGVARPLPTEGEEQAELTYHPVHLCLRIEPEMADVDIAIALMAAMQTGSRVQLSVAQARPWLTLFAEQYAVLLRVEDRAEYEERFPAMAEERLLLRDPAATRETLARAASCRLSVVNTPVLANGRLEMLYCLEERVRIEKKLS